MANATKITGDVFPNNKGYQTNLASKKTKLVDFVPRIVSEM